MKFIPADESRHFHRIELTERNLRVLLAKLQDQDSKRTLIDPDYRIMVVAVPDEEHYSDRSPGEMAHEPIKDDE